MDALPLPPNPKAYALRRALRRCLATPVAAALDIAGARELHDLLLPLLQRIPAIELTDQERRRLGALCTATSIAVCHKTGRALQRDPELFPDSAAVAVSLQTRSQRAVVLQGVSFLLKLLARRVDDLILLDLASGTSDAIAVHQAVREDVEAGDERPAAGWRLIYLGAARRILQESRPFDGQPRKDRCLQRKAPAGVAIAAILDRVSAALARSP